MKRLSSRAAIACAVALYFFALAGAVALVWTAHGTVLERVLTGVGALLAEWVLLVSYAVHEAGHLLSGLAAGLSVGRVCVGRLCVSREGVRIVGRARQAGETAFWLRTERGARTRLFIAALGGPAAGLAFGALFLALYFTLPYHPALLFFAVLALFCMQEALSELLPAQLLAGNTDGMTLAELAAHEGETEVALRVMRAQCRIKKEDIASLPRELLYDVPVVREDAPVFSELMKLRIAWCEARSDEDGAAAARARLSSCEEE